MKKLLLLVGIGLLFSLSIAEAAEPKIGLGYTFDTGIHFRYQKVELQAVFGEPAIYGGRFYAKEWRTERFFSAPFSIYAGLEANFVSSKFTNFGFTIGPFIGFEKPVWGKLNLGLDFGLQSVFLKGWETVSGLGLVLNTRLTWYF